ncbi:MAG: glycosyltransferase family 4 protein [Spirochaetes bacterium]|nr:glycosyltransferase family 4 protein [Spirochaetota bacterium]
MKKINFPYKICIPYHDRPEGGVYKFLKYFKTYLKRNHLSYTERLLSRYDILFINSFKTPYYIVKMLKLLKPGLKIIHRIDGAAEDYGRGKEWDVIQKKVNKITDLTIFQSKYSRYATRKKFHVISHDGPIIYNPVDTNLFKAAQKRFSTTTRPKIAHVTFSTNVKKGASNILQIAQKNPELDFILIGQFDPDQRVDLKNVRYTGVLDHHQVAKTLGSCHLFLFFSQNESCPNVVLEAMASGLPVLYLDSGATSELVGNTGKKTTEASFKNNFNTIWKNWPKWSTLARTRIEKNFSVEKIIPQYLNAVSGIMKK